jgi:hypothetical protein
LLRGTADKLGQPIDTYLERDAQSFSDSITDRWVTRELVVLFQTTIFTMLFQSKSKLIVVAASLFSAVHGKDIHVSPSGTGTGSQTAPYGSIQAAVNAAAAGDSILLRAGTYKPTTNIQITKSGTSTSPITLRSYQEEKVILDGENLPG